jgi:hypothetical protein
MFRKLFVPAVMLMGAASGLSGCGSSPTQTPVFDPQTSNLPGALSQNSGSGTLFTFGGNKGSGGQTGTGIQVNAYLWRASLDTLSFMPLVSADPFGGVIITDWYVPPGTPNERFKANAYILSQTMSANAVQVSVFHQVQENGQWVDAQVDPATASGLEDRILSRAADLKAEAQNTRG